MVVKPILYEIVPSPPVRAVKMLAKALNIDLELKTVDLFNKAQYSEEYLKISPTHTVPTLNDNGFILWDSHAILMYLADKYSKNDSFYPKDSMKRIQINQLLFCEASIFSKLIKVAKPIFFEGVKKITDVQKADVEDSYQTLERILTGKNYVSGDEVTIADISAVPTLTSLNILVPIDSKKFPNILAWIKRMELLTFYEPNAVGLKAHQEIFKKFLN